MCDQGIQRGVQRAGGALKKMAVGGLLPKTTELHTGCANGPKNKQRSCTPDVQMGAIATELVHLA